MEFIPYKPRTEKILGRDWEFMQQSHHMIRQRREELKLTQQEVAEKAGILLRQYTRFETGERDICSSSARIVLSISAVLKLDPYVLFPEIEMYQKKDEKNGETERHMNPYYIPAKKATIIPVSTYIAIICKIPKGKLTRWEDITAYLEKIYGVEYVKPAESYWEKKTDDGSEIPYWRIVGPRGHLYNDSRVGSKYIQLERLKNEGIIAELCNERAQTYRVKKYKELLFDFSVLDADEIKTIPNNDRTTAEVATKLMFHEANIHMVPLEILQRVANGKMYLDSEYIEKAQKELDKRKKTK